MKVSDCVRIVCFLWISITPFTVLADSKKITVMVVDKMQTPVSGAVLLNPGGRQIGKTAADGKFTFNHVCAAGQTFKAQPTDGAKYYDSEEQVCNEMVVLQVFPRPKHRVWSAYTPYIREVTAGGETSGVIYAGVFGAVTDEVEPVTGGKAQCKLSIKKDLTVGYYSNEIKDWKEVVAGVPATKRPDDVYFFPTSCDDASDKIQAIKKQSNIDLKSGLQEFYNVHYREIGNAVTSDVRAP